MIKLSTEMYVEKIGERGQYDQHIMLRADKTDEGVKYPQHIDIVIKAKKYDAFPEIIKDDRVLVDLYPTSKVITTKAGREMVITELIAMKLSVTEHAANAAVADAQPEEEDLPF